MKKPILLIALCFFSTLVGHGFIGNTSILLAYKNDYQSIRTLCTDKRCRKVKLIAYDARLGSYVHERIRRRGVSKSSCYVEIQIATPYKTDTISCTPTQSFYSAITKQRIRAADLQINDELLCVHNNKCVVTSVRFVQRPTTVYAIEVKHNHTFCVSSCNVITHNMELSEVLDVGMVTPLTYIATGTITSAFHPATLVAGIVVGGIVATTLLISSKSKLIKYELPEYKDKHKPKKKHKKRLKQQEKENKAQVSTGGPGKKPDEDDNQDTEDEPRKVNNMKEFFNKTKLGRKIKECVEKTKRQYHGQSIYRVKKSIKGTELRRGDQIYLDGKHQDHLEVFSRQGEFRFVLRLDGTKIVGKTLKAHGRIIK